MNVAGLILAGGASQRMGQPKALLPYRGETFLNRLIGLMLRECDSVTVVLGYHAEPIQASVQRPARIVVNPEPERGQLSSFQCALRAMPSAQRLLYTPVDYPGIAAETIHALLGQPCESFVIPRYEGRRGHPILCTWAMAEEILALPLDSDGAREVVHRHVGSTRYIDVADAGILRDIDDAEAYAELLQADEVRAQ